MKSATAVASEAGGTSYLTFADKLSIAALLQKFEHIWNEGQVPELEALFTIDAECVNVTGLWWRGRTLIIKALETFHATMFRTEELAIREVAPEVAVATATQGSYGFKSRNGPATIETLNRLTFVIAKKNERWLIANIHGTLINREAQKHDPFSPAAS